MPKVFAVQNPVAGTQSAEVVSRKLQGFFNRVGWQHHIYQTQQGDDVTAVSRSAAKEGYDLFVAAGGDGTISAVATGISEDQIPLGIVPVGTGNDMAYGLGLRGTLEETITALSENYRQKIDIGFVKGGDYPEGRYFANGVGIGFDATWADLRKFAPSTALFTPRQSFCEHIGQEKT